MKKIKIQIIRESKQKFIKENMEQALDTLKDIRRKTDEPNARAFFNEIKTIDNKDENGFDDALSIFQSHFPNIQLTTEYTDKVKKYSRTIYKLFYDKFLQQNQVEDNYGYSTNTITSESAKPLKINSFYFAIAYFYSALCLNDEQKMYELFHEVNEKLNNIIDIQQKTIISFLLGICLLFMNVLKLNLSLTGAGIFFIIISIIFMLIRSIQVEIDTYRVRKTGDVDGSLL